MSTDPEVTRRQAEAEAEIEAMLEVRRRSIAAEVRSLDDPSGIDETTFTVEGSAADVAHAQKLLAGNGMIPASDLSGHRGAITLWRDHCETMHGTQHADLLSAIDRVLAAPRPVHPASGSDEPAPFYAWVRPSDIPVTDHEDFPYHHTPAELVEIAANLIQEAGDPAGLADILGDGLSLSTTATPRGPVHLVTVNGNHRAAIIRAAGFPVALAEITLQNQPWEIGDAVGAGTQTLVRLLYRCGLLTNHQPDGPTGEGLDTIDADGISSWLLGFESAEAARNNLIAFEAMFGRDPDPRLDWIRDAKSFNRLLRHERMVLPEYGLDVLPRIAGHWPPRPTVLQRLEHMIFGRRSDGWE